MPSQDGVDADLEMKAMDAIVAGEDCPDCGATWKTPEPEGGRANANMVMVHAESCILYRASYVGETNTDQAV
jgi:hypothetical protein